MSKTSIAVHWHVDVGMFDYQRNLPAGPNITPVILVGGSVFALTEGRLRSFHVSPDKNIYPTWELARAEALRLMDEDVTRMGKDLLAKRESREALAMADAPELSLILQEREL